MNTRYGFHIKVRQNTGLYFFMVEDAVNVDTIDFFKKGNEGISEVLEFILMKNTW
jgi:hypothetical protein